MSFKWDFEKKKLVEGESPDKDFPMFLELFILPACVAIGWVFINYIAPWLGHLFFGNFL